LTNDTWANGELTADVTAISYSFSVTSGKTYFVYLADYYCSSVFSDKTADIKVSASYSSGSSIFSNWDGDNIGKYFTASSNGTVNIVVIAYNSTNKNTGTFAVKYAQSTSKIVTFDANGADSGTVAQLTPDAGTTITMPSGSGLSKTNCVFSGWNIYNTGKGDNYNVGSSYLVMDNITFYAKWTSTLPGGETNPIPLTDTLTAETWTDGSITASTPSYEMWYSFNVTNGTKYYIWWNDYGQGSGKSLDVYVSASYNNGSSIFTNIDSAYNTPRTFTANSTGTVKIRVVSIGTDTGTFAIRYSTFYPCLVTFNINGGTGTAPTAQTVNADSAMTLPDGSGFSKSGYTFGGWTTNLSSNSGSTYNAGASFTPNSNAVTLYAVWISSLPGSGTETAPYQLTANTWADGIITTTNKNAWYSFDVTSGTKYYIWWNDGYSGGGDGTKIVDVLVTASYSGGSSIFTAEDAAWNSPKSFTATSTGTVKVRVYPYTGTGSGSATDTFAIVFSESSTRPTVP